MRGAETTRRDRNRRSGRKRQGGVEEEGDKEYEEYLVASEMESQMMAWRVTLVFSASLPPLRMRPLPLFRASAASWGKASGRDYDTNKSDSPHYDASPHSDSAEQEAREKHSGEKEEEEGQEEAPQR